MSEHEESQQIGRLAEDYARLKDEVRHIEDRVERVRRACQVVAISFADIIVHDDRLTIEGAGEHTNGSNGHLENLLNTRELTDLFHERKRLRCELDHVRGKLREWLSHI
jgi:hypothetical protein